MIGFHKARSQQFFIVQFLKGHFSQGYFGLSISIFIDVDVPPIRWMVEDGMNNFVLQYHNSLHFDSSFPIAEIDFESIARLDKYLLFFLREMKGFREAADKGYGERFLKGRKIREN